MQTWRDLMGHFQHITEVLSKDKARIFDSLLGNLTQMLDLMPAYSNLFNDAELVQCAQEAKATLSTINPDDLRADPDIRKSVCKKAEALLSKWGQLGARKFA